MCRFLLQPIILFLFFHGLTSNSESQLTKRSPLELGFVTFPAAENSKRAILPNKTKAEMNFEVMLNLSSPLSHHAAHDRVFYHEWIPGNVRHHLFIPPHVRHYFVPFLITKAVIVKSPYEVYPRAYGGFGVGAVTGGHGAGHGFHVVLHH